MTGQMTSGFTRRQKSDIVSFVATSTSKKNSIFVKKGLNYSVNRASPSPASSDRIIFVLAVAGQIPATTSTGFCFKACLEQALSRLQAIPLSKKFEKLMVEGILRREFQNVSLAARSFHPHHSNLAGWF